MRYSRRNQSGVGIMRVNHDGSELLTGQGDMKQRVWEVGEWSGTCSRFDFDLDS